MGAMLGDSKLMDKEQEFTVHPDNTKDIISIEDALLVYILGVELTREELPQDLDLEDNSF